MLFGGRLRRPGYAVCSRWARPGLHNECGCAAPLSLLGANHTVVEIGANDGMHMSNSFFFERQLGWRSMCVEPNRALFDRLVANRPGCVNVNALVGSPTDFNGSRRVPFISISPPDASGSGERAARRDPNSADPNAWETGLSGIEGFGHFRDLSTAQSWAAHISRGRYRTPGALTARRDMLKVEAFSELFARHGFESIDFLSIDVEGAEAAVLRTIDFRRVRVRLIGIETVDDEVRRLLARRGFFELGIRTNLGDRYFAHRRHFGELASEVALWGEGFR